MSLVRLRGHHRGRPIRTEDPGIPDPTMRPRALCTGFMGRNFENLLTAGGSPGNMHAQITAGVGGGIVCFPNWCDLEASGGLIDSAMTALEHQLDQAHALGIGVRLRVLMGWQAPDYVKNDPLVGSYPWATNSGNVTGGVRAGTVGTSVYYYLPKEMPGFWTPKYIEYLRRFDQRLSDRIGGHPGLYELVVGWPATQFAEPCQSQFNWQPNLDQAVANGYTKAIHDALFTASWESYMEFWAPHGVACYAAWNPIGDIVPAATPSGVKYTNGNVPRTIALMEKQVETCGLMAVVGNNSLTPHETNSQYNQMYVKHYAYRTASPPHPVSFQTETLDKINSNYSGGLSPTSENVKACLFTRCLDEMLGLGAEVPVGCQTLDSRYPDSYITPAIAADFNQQCKNMVGQFIDPGAWA